MECRTICDIVLPATPAAQYIFLGRSLFSIKEANHYFMPDCIQDLKFPATGRPLLPAVFDGIDDGELNSQKFV